MSNPSYSPVAREIRRLAVLGGPVALTQLGLMMMGVVDTLMVGHLGVHELDAASLGNVWLFGTIVFGLGMVHGVDPIVTQAHGARDGARVGLTLQQGLVVCLLLSVPIALSWLATGPALRLLGQSPALSASAHLYLSTQIPSIPAFLGFVALRQYLQGRGVVMPALIMTIVANGFNVVANWALIFGHLGLPAMGLLGAALATTATRLFLLLGLVVLVMWQRLHEGAWVRWSRRALDLRDIARIFRFGTPVALQFGLEAWAFQIATLMAGRLGEVHLAAHTIGISLISLSFMVPLGLSIGATTRVGNLIGEGRPRDAQRAAFVALGLGAAVMLVSAAAFVFLRWRLPAFYTEDAAVIALAAAILPVAAAFQLFDGIQVMGGGILRGMGNTVPAAVFNLVGYYVIALPLGAWLTFGTSLGLAGIWWGLALGLALVGGAITLWVVYRGPARVDTRAHPPS